MLFAGQDAFERLFLDGIAAAAPDADAVRGRRAALGPSRRRSSRAERRAYSRQRQTIIDADPGLQERELLKLAGLATAMAAALRERGAPEPTAALSAECGVTVFRVAFARWVGGSEAATWSRSSTRCSPNCAC